MSANPGEWQFLAAWAGAHGVLLAVIIVRRVLAKMTGA